MVTTETKFEGLGWNVFLQQKGQQYLLTLPKEIATGSLLEKGDPIFYYFVECDGRKALLVYLDKKKRPKENKVRLRGISFLVKK